jgi:putative nucleotidyltransferase with HDIG domain
MAASLVVRHLARRLLPLEMLLRLSLTFPDHTPSRFRVALRAGSVGRLRREAERVRASGVGDDVDVAAETVLVLATALNVHDPDTRGHSERVRALTEMLAAEMHLAADDVERLRWSALLHDCGKLMVHPDVLRKEGPLDDADWEAIHRHPEEGAKLTAPLRGWLGQWGAAIEEHHERWDGQGYPNRLAGEELSLGGRIVAVADAYEVMTSARSYKVALPPEEARAEIAAQAGSQFDPDVVRALLRVSLGRAGWLAGLVGWIGGLSVVRRVVAHVPRELSAPGLTAATLTAGAVLGLAVPTVPGTPADRAWATPHTTRAPVSTIEPALPPAEVLGEQFVAPAPMPAGPPATSTAGRAPTTTSAPPPPPGPPSTEAGAVDDCTEQARSSTAAAPAGEKLAEVRAGQRARTSHNPNCEPLRPGSP